MCPYPAQLVVCVPSLSDICPFICNTRSFSFVYFRMQACAHRIGGQQDPFEVDQQSDQGRSGYRTVLDVAQTS
jgi:hypothetical protein